MAALIKELLYDYVDGKLDSLTKADIDRGISSLLAKRIITRDHLLAVRDHLLGESLHLPEKRTRLIQFTSALEYEIRYEDEDIIRLGLRRFPRYRKIAQALRKYLFQEGRRFTYDD